MRARFFAAAPAPARLAFVRAFERGERPQDVTPVLIAAGDQNGMSGRLPKSSLQGFVPRRKRSGRTLAMHPHVAQLRVLFMLHEVVADLVDEFQLRAKRLAESFCHL